jgi:hypothetical protein
VPSTKPMGVLTDGDGDSGRERKLKRRLKRKAKSY